MPLTQTQATKNSSTAHNQRIAEYGLFIDGIEKAADSGETYEVISPTNGQVIGRAALGEASDVDRAIASSRRAFEDKAWREISERSRARLVLKLADVVEDNLEELFHLETLNNGRPINETRAQISRIPDLFRYNAGLALARRDASIPVEGNYLAYTQRSPVGVVGNITPFNHPLLIMCRNLAPAFATGCTTVVKPSEYTPLTALRLARLFLEAGLPPGVFNIVTGMGAGAGKALSEHPGINKLVLTGGTESGRMAGAAAARNFVRVTLELGGKTPVLVFDDYDVDQAVNYAAFGAFIGAGQTCVCASRHIVHRRIYDEFVEKLARKAKSIRIGDPASPDTQLGPVISARQRERVLGYVRSGLEEGARLVAGGKAPDGKDLAAGFYVEPTVFADVRPEMRIAREEVFGPFTVVIPFESEEEGIRIANDSPYGLGGAIRTNNVARAHRVAAKLQCGFVWVNDHHRVDWSTPWGGIKQSGINREFGEESFNNYLETKVVMVNVSDQGFDWYAPNAKHDRLN
jgi:acyl-CoA reductase-like NAD-dependent aldehyde dehydrogenase